MPAGRPPKEIDFTQFESLCALQCTQGEIAGFFKINAETLKIKVEAEYKEKYPAVFEKFSSSGKCNLRKTQLRVAQKNAAMGIWLGKQWLGQKDEAPKITIDEGASEHLASLMNAMNYSQAKEAVRQIKKLEDNSEQQ